MKSPVRFRFSVGELILHIVLIAGACLMVLPLFWMASSSLKDISQIFLIPPKWIPDPFVWSNFERSLQALPFGRAYFNSIYISLLVVLLQLFTCSLAAFSFAKINFPFRNVLFILFVAMMMVPEQVTIIPLYLIMKEIGWLDTHLSIIVPPALFSAFGVFLLRQFFLTIPKDLDEAAIVDGASLPTIYFRIMLPLVKPSLSALGIFTFLYMWNNFFHPVIFLSTPNLYTVPLMLNMFKGLYITDWTLMMAGSTIALVPALIAYLFTQRYVIEGIAMTGIKG
ncbi:carbohydrate ABC transporter permease [Paenibacillus thermotolerans]|uniref:carbohydrate ABC transporter permease n=1 Tax=Paenibacillus thermotolerans TaxID=3027807 RepID=UPI0023689BE6|nr:MULTISPECIES: carbohydrate ABC transporter permease [unclassified Paenibacillus]